MAETVAEKNPPGDGGQTDQGKKRKGRKKFFTRRKHWYEVKTGSNNERSKQGFHFFDTRSAECSAKKSSSHPMHDAEMVESISISGNSFTKHFMLVKTIVPTRRKMRCLSLCDGISTGLHILTENLNVDLEVYFSSEIDENCLVLQQERYFGRMIQLGDMRNINENLLSSLLPIDLLLAGTPCNELSLVNWRGRGLHDPKSSGHLFFKFKFIKDYLEKKMALVNRPFFFLLENTANMKIKVKNAITKELNLQGPVLCCATQFHPMKRERYFWSNIPRIEFNDIAICQKSTLSLQSFMGPGRYATQDIAKTITSNRWNQKSANGALPVETIHGTKYYTINEIESLMGLPPHFSDVGNLKPTQRLKLIANGWCVPIIQNILSPLTDLYHLKQK